MALREFAGTITLLCAYGFFKEVRPSEAYLTEYLTGPDLNLDQDEVYQKVYPVWSYSYFALLIPVFLLTDLLRYKPVIMFEGVAYVLTWVLILWGTTIPAMQAMQFVYGVATSTEIAYYTYIYAKVSKDDYQRVSSFTRASILMGKFLSGLLAQILDSLNLLDYRELNYIALSSVSIAFMLSIFLPPVKTSIYFHKEDNENKSFSAWQIVQQIAREARSAYSNAYVTKWSVWVAISTCLNFQVGNYIQPLWEEIRPFEGEESSENSSIYNGAVEAATTLLGALTVFAVGFLLLRWRKWGDVAILVVALLGGAILVGMSQTDLIWIAYVGYILFRMSYQLMMTVASFEIAKEIVEDSYGLIFGINTWFGLGFQTVLTLVVADSVGLALPIRDQFVVYGALYMFAGISFAIFFAAKRFCQPNAESSMI